MRLTSRDQNQTSPAETPEQIFTQHFLCEANPGGTFCLEMLIIVLYPTEIILHEKTW